MTTAQANELERIRAVHGPVARRQLPDGRLVVLLDEGEVLLVLDSHGRPVASRVSEGRERARRAGLRRPVEEAA